jgi:hypothetical protein
MTLKKPMPLILLLFTIMCALPATTTVIPSAIAQEDDDMSLDEAENLASGTVSNVLDSGSTAGDNTNTQLSVPLIDQNQTDANLGLSEALDVTVERTLSPQEEEEPPEFVAFCLVFTGPGGDPITGCFDTSDECEIAQDILVDLFPDILISECDGFETLPPNAADCNIVEDQEGEQIEVNCVSQEI